MGVEKYSKEAPFEDPIVRCCECNKIVIKLKLKEQGMCPYCGNRRVRNVLTMSDEEMTKLKDQGVDTAFIALFEGVEDE